MIIRTGFSQLSNLLNWTPVLLSTSDNFLHVGDDAIESPTEDAVQFFN